jgi:small-conductance mechanosensitive channel
MLIPSILLVAWVIVVFIVTPIVVRGFRKAAERTKSQLDDIIADSLRGPLVIILSAIGLKIWSDTIMIPPTQSKYITIAMIGLFALGMILFLDKLLANWIAEYSKNVSFVRTSGSLLKTVFRIAILMIAVLIIFDSLGVSITPLIASLGVGSVAIALALKDTLSNLFAGIHILVDKPVKVGDYVKLDSGEQGYVTMVGWRTTRIKMLPNNDVIIPNSKLANTQITNYYSPVKELSVLVQVGVSYESDLDQVERVTIEVGKETLSEVEGGVSDFEPFIRYHTFDNFSINFSVILRAKEYVDSYRIKHEFIKKLHKRYNKEGIVIPFPITTLDFDKKQMGLAISDSRQAPETL